MVGIQACQGLLPIPSTLVKQHVYLYKLMLPSSLMAWLLIYGTSHITQAAQSLPHSLGLLSQHARGAIFPWPGRDQAMLLRTAGHSRKPAAVLTQLDVFSFVLINLMSSPTYSQEHLRHC